jgi:hypothetical protein
VAPSRFPTGGYLAAARAGAAGLTACNHTARSTEGRIRPCIALSTLYISNWFALGRHMYIRRQGGGEKI